MDDITPIGAHAAGFESYSKAFIKLVKDLKRLGLKIEDASCMALDLAQSYMQFSNNDKFAEKSSPVAFIHEGE